MNRECVWLTIGPVLVGFNNNDNFNINCNNNLNYNGCARGMVLTKANMQTYTNIYEKICCYDNLFLAYKKSRKRKTQKKYVIEFEKNLNENLSALEYELRAQTYKPKPLETFVVNDPKTRRISKSDFRDRIVHHAICNIITPIFETEFIYDNYANRIGKGTTKAIERFEKFQKKATKNNTQKAYALKADVKHYFENIKHKILIDIIGKKIRDSKCMRLITIILKNHQTTILGKGMPLGNLTSQFFANVYLNELDQYIKRKLRIKYYIRYVDDIIILENDKIRLENYKRLINQFLKYNLDIELHPEKTGVRQINRGIKFLGMRIYPNHRLLAKKNIRKFFRKISTLINYSKEKTINHDKIYDFLEGWIAYARKANTYNMIRKFLKPYTYIINNNISTKEYNRCSRNDKNHIFIELK